ncbi:M42 family metallopeptidase [Effusibacillus dendaii]|uniref:Endoglucanase n=1 Tax=Effusibacillus dendaii TaxID=2743772 RepID=A0A7I8D5H0_9BACL|nr:M42 family metallopeptidase [Effusibacillus dendaii]BCJ85393.1 hypothetical protein skT53_03780 [Effusibacillus dendaii]
MNEKWDGKQILLQMMETPGVSGYESAISKLVESQLRLFTDKIKRDKVGNLIACVEGEGDSPRPRILIAAHMDEIGLIVTKIEQGGFVRFTQLGGFDPRTLIGQEVVVHGRTDCHGIVGSKPPHLTKPEEREKTIPLKELYIDLAMPEASVQERVQVGDIITIHRKAMQLQNGFLAGKALDNRASVAAMLECLQEMKRLRIQADVYAVATVQEEVGLRGAVTAAFGIDPDIGIALDVTHGLTPGTANDLAFKPDAGCVIAGGPNIHREIFEKFSELAKRHNIKHQIRFNQGPTGTDANAIQITRDGIPTGLLSVPLRYMHTSVETICYRDVERTGKLLAYFIEAVDQSFVEGLSCYLKN